MPGRVVGSGVRRFLLGALAALTTLALAAPAPAATVPAYDAAAFSDSVGVVTHGDYFDTAYGDADRVVAALTRLGVRYVREGVQANPERKFEAFNARHDAYLDRLHAAGIRASFLMGKPGNTRGTLDELLAKVRDRHLAMAASLEGPNEYDLSGDPEWMATLRDYQRQLYEKAKADPALRHLPVLAPAMGRKVSYDTFGDIGMWADRGNVHPYPGGLAPEDWLTRELGRPRQIVPGKPVQATETGYHNGMADQTTHYATSERAAGAYLPRLLLDHFTRGVERTYVYELLDEKPDPELDNREQHFGLLRNDFSFKPAATALANLMAIAGTGSGGPAALDVDLTGGLEDARAVALRQGPGSALLVLWHPDSVWDRFGRQDLFPAPRTGTVRIAGATTADVFRLGISDQPLARVPAGGQIALELPAEDTVALRVSFGDAPGAPAPASGLATTAGVGQVAASSTTASSKRRKARRACATREKKAGSRRLARRAGGKRARRGRRARCSRVARVKSRRGALLN